MQNSDNTVRKPVYLDYHATTPVDPDNTTLNDPNGRPQHLLDQGQPIRELI